MCHNIPKSSIPSAKTPNQIKKRKRKTNKNSNISGLSDTKLHDVLLDHKEIKLSWMIDWHKKEVLFHIQNAFDDKHRWFYLGFQKRADDNHANADICFFENQNGVFNVVTDTYTSPCGTRVHKDYKQDCEVFKMDETALAFKRKFDTCDPLDLRMHVRDY